MATITEDYVSFETAKLLKEKGFDKTDCKNSTHFAYNADGQFSGPSWDSKYDAPTLQMARKWLKEKYNIHIEVVHLNADRHTYYLYRYYSCQSERYVQHTNPEYSTYEQAVEAAIKYCLENLI